jgi:predicted nucleic acid-binding Zn ribbon protein
LSIIGLLSTLNERRKPPMSNNYRELTGREKQRIKKLVISLCANYDKEYGCLPLDCDCPMLGICFTNSALCRYFRKSVLPEDAGLEAVFTQTPTTHCKQCGKPFPTDGKRVYCSQRCAEEACRKQTAARVRKYREKQQQM